MRKRHVDHLNMPMIISVMMITIKLHAIMMVEHAVITIDGPSKAGITTAQNVNARNQSAQTNQYVKIFINQKSAKRNAKEANAKQMPLARRIARVIAGSAEVRP